MRQFEVLKPACYELFSCKGGSCRFSCCSRWSIQLCEKERRIMEKKAGVPPELFHLMEKDKQVGDIIYELALDEEQGCPLLTEEKLCSVQLKHGREPMPAVCREYPRHYHKYRNKLELGLSLGCEKVLELLLDESDGLLFMNHMEKIPDYQRFLSDVDERTRKKHPALIYYYDIQALCLGILQAKDACIEDRMIILSMALFRINTMAADGTRHNIPAYINRFINSIEEINITEQLQDLNIRHISSLCSNLYAIKHLFYDADTPYSRLVDNIAEKLKVKETHAEMVEDKASGGITFEYSTEAYDKCRETFSRFIKGKEHFLENAVVAAMFHFDIPFYNPSKGIWKDYTYLIWLYTIMRFVLTASLDEESSAEDMIDSCVILFRRLGHNSVIYDYIVDNLEKNQSNSPAHMAIFLKSV